MAAFLLAHVNLALRRLENTIARALDHQFPSGAFALAGVDSSYDSKNANPQSSFNWENLLGDGFLWAAPRNRRTVEKRLKRKFGSPEYNMKLIMPKSNLLVCNACGHYHEAGVLCSHCYEKVCLETEAMQAAVQAELGLSPVDKEVVILYEGEREHQPVEFWEGKKIIEMKKPRPAWFSKNLLQQSTAAPATTGDVKPSELA